MVNGSTPGEEGRRFDSRFWGTVRIPFFPTSVTLPPVYLVNGSTPGEEGRRFDSPFLGHSANPVFFDFCDASAGLLGQWFPVYLVNGSTPGSTPGYKGRRFDSRFGGSVRIPFFSTSVTLPPVYLVNGSTPGSTPGYKGRRFDSPFLSRHRSASTWRSARRLARRAQAGVVPPSAHASWPHREASSDPLELLPPPSGPHQPRGEVARCRRARASRRGGEA